MLVLGIIIGLLIALLILVIEIRLVKNKPIVEKIIQRIEPKKKGGVFIPLSDEDEAREEVVKRNSEQGKTTYLKDLYE